MVSFLSYIAPVMAVLGTVRAGFYTTYPVGADAIKSGQTITITWKPDTIDPVLTNVPQYTLKFMTGGNFVQTTVATIGTFDISKQSVTYTIPKTAPGMYFLMYTASTGGSSWSTRFSVDGGDSWYPEGVATGVDPGTSTTGAVPSPSASKSTGGQIGEPETASNTAVPSASKEEPTSSTKEEETTAKTTADEKPTPSSSPAPATTKAKSSVAATTEAKSDAQEATDGSEDTENTEDTDATSEEGDLETEKKSSAHSSSATNKTSKTTSSDNSAATRYLSMAAALAAAAFML